MPEKVFIRGIPDNLWRALKAKASLDGLTVSKAIQRAIRQYLQGVRYQVGATASSYVTEARRSGEYVAEPRRAKKRKRRPAEPVLATFEGRITNARTRQLPVPPEIQQTLGLHRKEDNDLLLISLRRKGTRRWSRHYLKLTADNALTVPADVERFAPKQDLVVRVHRVILDWPVERSSQERTAADVLLELMGRSRPGWREDGVDRLDEILNEEISGS